MFCLVRNVLLDFESVKQRILKKEKEKQIRKRKTKNDEYFSKCLAELIHGVKWYCIEGNYKML